MARVDPKLGLLPSILDRLIDADSGGTSVRPGYNIDQVVDCVRRDLEDLLNTRFTMGDICKARKRLGRSVLAFGLPDLVSQSALSPGQKAEIGKMLERTVSMYEPRLKHVRAYLIDTEKPGTVRFRMEARLTVEPAPEVIFDTMMELTTGQHTVRQSSKP